MQNIYKTLWLGSSVDYETIKNQQGWYIVQMAKEPYHHEIAGNYQQDLPKTDPNFYFAENKNRIAFNLMDYGNSDLIPKPIFNKAIAIIHQKLLEGVNVLVHCTFGRSRSASAVLLYLAVYTDFFNSKDFIEVEKEFTKIYSNYKPSLGVNGFLMNNWNQYMGNK